LSEGGSLGEGGLYCIQEIIWQTVRFAGGLSAAVLMLAEDFYLSTLPGAEAYTAILLRELLFFEKLFCFLHLSGLYY